MSDFVIGDVQGCFGALVELLAKIGFQRGRDRLFFAGDLVARGPDSLATLRLIHSLGDSAYTVLGNHDLHLLAVHHGHREPKAKDGIEPILAASDRDQLLHWLQRQPLLHELPDGSVLSHAGIAPHWTRSEALAHAQQVAEALQSPQASEFLASMYGDHPNQWQPSLSGTERLRVITNYFTRMRAVDADGALHLAYKGDLANLPDGLMAWFHLPNRLGSRQYFGHWAALLGETGVDHAIALDTGCVWGERLCALRLQDGQRFYSSPGQR